MTKGGWSTRFSVWRNNPSEQVDRDKDLLFVNKKKQKTFLRCVIGVMLMKAEAQSIKSFLVLFFKKEPLLHRMTHLHAETAKTGLLGELRSALNQEYGFLEARRNEPT